MEPTTTTEDPGGLHIVRSHVLEAKWGEFRTRVAFPCALGLTLSVVLGLVTGRPAWGLIMAGGALAVGFGSFQMIGRSRTAAMIVGTLGIALSTLAGSLLSVTEAGLLTVAVLAGFGAGWLTALGPGVAWIGLQCAIAAIISSGFPSFGPPALERGSLILAGGLLQTLIVLFFRRLHTHFHAPPKEDPYEGLRPAVRLLRENFQWSSASFRYGIHLALTLAAAALAARVFAVSNGYWVPMTALLVLKPDPHHTLGRGLARIAGTLVGAGVATLLAVWLHPNPVALAGFVALFGWLCFSLVNVNYGLFSACITAYIAFLLAFTGQPTKNIAIHRIANTLMGGCIALVAYAPGIARRRAAPEAPGGGPRDGGL
ncbi:MAG TPA: FUSC family protein [Chthoniobacteraceae bacterium]|jgi:hypothetical protein|nr:FUSC family protein [Chthoniobacteraceae bacterium]